MSKTLFDTPTEIGTRFRVKQLRPHTPAKWGRTNASRVLRHMTELLEAPLGTGAAPARWSPLMVHAARWVYLQGAPCADEKSLVASDEVTPADVAAWDAAVNAWYDACSRFVARGKGPTPFAPHPAFGKLEAEEWGRLAYFHTAYHLRQLGV